MPGWRMFVCKGGGCRSEGRRRSSTRQKGGVKVQNEGSEYRAHQQVRSVYATVAAVLLIWERVLCAVSIQCDRCGGMGMLKCKGGWWRREEGCRSSASK